VWSKLPGKVTGRLSGYRCKNYSSN